MSIAPYSPPPAELAATDPTGGRLVAWAEAASAANSLAKALSTTAFVPREMQNVGNATAAILAGDEVGLSPLAALRSIYVVHGTPAFYARTMVALALSHGHEIWTAESTDSKVTVQGRRRGTDNIESATWTMQRAQKAGYTSNKKYATNAQEMLYSKAAAEIARKIAADVLAGMPTSVEELELDTGPATTTMQRPSAGTSKVSRAKKPEPEPEQDEPAESPIVDAIREGESEGDTPSQKQTAHMFALFRDVFTDMPDARTEDGRAVRLKYISGVVGREVESSKELTAHEVAWVIESLKTDQSQAEPRQEQPEQMSDDDFAKAAGVEPPADG